MRLTRLLLAAAAATAVLPVGGCGAGNSALAKRGGSLTLKVDLDKGAKYTYDSTLKISSTGGPMPMDMSQTSTNVVEIVDKTAGGFKVKTTLADLKIDMGKAGGMGASAAAQADSMKGTTFESSYDSAGRQQEMDVHSSNAKMQSLGGAMSGMNFGFEGFVCPDKPVRIGSTWDTSMDLGKIIGKMLGGATDRHATVPITYKLVNVEERGGKTVADIEVEMIGSVDLSAMGQATKVGLVVKGTMHVDVDKGLVLDSTLKGDETVDAGQVKMKLHMDVANKLKS